MKRSGDAIEEKETQRPKVDHDGDESDKHGVEEPKEVSALDMAKTEQQEKEDEEDNGSAEEEDEEEDEEEEEDENEGTSSRKAITEVTDSEEHLAASSPNRNQEGDTDISTAVKVSYPKPKNFAERMMNALERGVASESVWWAGGGKAIALDPTKLKDSPHLKSYFKAKDYSAFIRNCNRWGFRRVATYEVPSGVVTYENSLFQRDNPHLCKHMRMDSDVQDVFARHQHTGEVNAAGGESEADKASRIIAEVKAMKQKSRTSRRQRNQGAVDPSQLLQPRQETAVLPAGITDDPTLSKEYMLHRILQMTGQYLALPGSLYADDSSMTTTMELVRTLGLQHQQNLNEFQLASIVQLQSSVGPPVTATAAAASFRPTVAAPKPPPPAAAAAAAAAAPPTPQAAPAPPASFSQGLSLGPGLTQHFMSRANINSALGANPLEAMLLRNQQASSHGRHILYQNQSVVDRLLAQQMQQQTLQGLLGSQGAADPAAVAAFFGNTTTNAPTQPKPQRQGESATTQEMKHDPGDGGGRGGSVESPQFTTAQELLSRLANQRRGPGGK